MKRCSRCGEQNRDEYNFCRNCGGPLNASPKGFRDSPAKMIIVIFIIGIIALAGASYVIFANHSFQSEDNPTQHSQEFDILDTDGDGALSFNEVEGVAPAIMEDELPSIFSDADTNNNGVLRGSELDSFLSGIESQYKFSEKNLNEKTVSSSSASQLNSVEADRCPECGSDAEYILDYYDEAGRPYYQCSVCGYWTYDEGDFY